MTIKSDNPTARTQRTKTGRETPGLADMDWFLSPVLNPETALQPPGYSARTPEPTPPGGIPAAAAEASNVGVPAGQRIGRGANCLKNDTCQPALTRIAFTWGSFKTPDRAENILRLDPWVASWSSQVTVDAAVEELNGAASVCMAELKKAMVQIQEVAFPRLTGAEVALVRPLATRAITRMARPSFGPVKRISIW